MVQAAARNARVGRKPAGASVAASKPGAKTAATPGKKGAAASRSAAPREAAPVPQPEDTTEPERGERAGTLARGLAILDALAGAPQPMTLAEVAAATSLDQSTTHRLLKALEDSGHLVRHEATRRYSPSPKLLHPLRLTHPLDQLRREAAPVLGELAMRLRLTTLLVLFVGNERLVLDLVQLPGSLLPYYGPWLKGAVHASGGGKALLLGLPEGPRRALVGAEPFEACTPHTHTTWATLDADLRASAQRGWVVSRNEHRDGITNIAALLKGWNGAAAGCVVATARSQDVDDAAVARIGDEVRRAADLLVFQAPSLEAASRFCGR